jgi:hypothetical protein
MAYNEEIVSRMKHILILKEIDFFEKKMFGGVCIMVDDKMCCGTHIDKNSGENLLLCRIGESKQTEIEDDVNCIPMEFTGKPMKGFVYILENGFSTNDKLAYWIQLCLDFNPLAKKSKK